MEIAGQLLAKAKGGLGAYDHDFHSWLHLQLLLYFTPNAGAFVSSINSLLHHAKYLIALHPRSQLSSHHTIFDLQSRLSLVRPLRPPTPRAKLLSHHHIHPDNRKEGLNSHAKPGFHLQTNWQPQGLCSFPQHLRHSIPFSAIAPRWRVSLIALHHKTLHLLTICALIQRFSSQLLSQR